MIESQTASAPVYQEYMNPLLEVLRSQGQALRIEELDRLVIAAMKLSADIVAMPHDPERPDRSEVSYRMAWARTYLKKAGLLENHPRGHWTISAKGRDAGTIDAYQLANDVSQALLKSTRSDGPVSDEVDEELLTARVGDELGRQISSLHLQLATDGQLLGADDAARAYARFRELFGPTSSRASMAKTSSTGCTCAGRKTAWSTGSNSRMTTSSRPGLGVSAGGALLSLACTGLQIRNSGWAAAVTSNRG